MKNHYKERIVDLLEKNMSEKGFKLWKGIDTMLPDVWDKPTSSTGKYHQKLNGDVPDLAEHVYGMLYTAVKLLKMFDYNPKTLDADKLLFAVALHDSLKYGNLGTRKHTDYSHDKEAADMIASNEATFRKLFDEEQFKVLQEAVRFHSGRWSTDVPKGKEFDWNEYQPETFFVHILDMLSTADIIQTDVRE
jgi:HD domain